MISRSLARLVPLVRLGLVILPLLAATCPEDRNSQFTILVRSTGSGAGRVVAGTGIACDVAPSQATGDCEELVIQQSGRFTFLAAPVGGSSFAGWVSTGDGSMSCTDPAGLTCEIVWMAGGPDTVLLLAHFVASGSVEHELRVTVVDPVTDTGGIRSTITSDDGEILCHEPGRASDRCTAWYPAGLAVALQSHSDIPSHTSESHDDDLFGWGRCTQDLQDHTACSVAMTADHEVTAYYAPRFAIVVRTGGGTGKVTSSDGRIDCDLSSDPYHPFSGSCFAAYETFQSGNYVLLSATAAPGSRFKEFYGDHQCNQLQCTILPSVEGALVRATFEFLANATLTLTLAGTGSGTVTSTPAGINCTSSAGAGSGTCSATFGGGLDVTLSATAAAGSTFGGWSGSGCSGNGTCVVSMTQANSVQVTFVPASQTLTIAGAGTGTGTVTSTPPGITCISTAGVTSGSCVASVGSGATMGLSASPAAGSTFTGWSAANCPGVSVCQVTVNAATTVTATFTATSTFTLTLQQGSAVTGNGTVTSSPAGIACTFTNGQITPSGTCAFAFPANAQVTLTPTPVAPSTFVTFTGASSCGFGVTACVVPMDQNRTVGVIFNP